MCAPPPAWSAAERHQVQRLYGMRIERTLLNEVKTLPLQVVPDIIYQGLSWLTGYSRRRR